MSDREPLPKKTLELYDELLNSAKIARQILDELNEQQDIDSSSSELPNKDIEQEKRQKKSEIYDKRKQIKRDFERRRYHY